MLTPDVTAYVDDPPNLVGAKKIHSPMMISTATSAMTNEPKRMRIGPPLNPAGPTFVDAPAGPDELQPSGA